ncbi:MAG: hypothetical protein IPL06_13475 [Betaproteobacteria bacterium]|nr:hypothetical protein [Betaproteobacteria bacterium]
MRIALAAIGFLAAACAAPGPTVLPDPMARANPASPPTTAAPVIGNAGFETDFVAGRSCPPRWSCSVHADGSSFRFAPDSTTASEGVRSLLLERVGREPWATVTQSFKAEGLRGKRVRFSIAVRAQGVDGEGAGAWLLLNGGGQVLDHQVRRLVGTGDWRRHEIEVLVPANAEYLSVGGTLEGGGRAWFDDARLELLGPAPGR